MGGFLFLVGSYEVFTFWIGDAGAEIARDPDRRLRECPDRTEKADRFSGSARFYGQILCASMKELHRWSMMTKYLAHSGFDAKKGGMMRNAIAVYSRECAEILDGQCPCAEYFINRRQEGAITRLIDAWGDERGQSVYEDSSGDLRLRVLGTRHRPGFVRRG